MAKKNKIENSDLFVVPLRNGQFGIGLVAKSAKNCFLAYYFKYILNNISDFKIEMINSENTILVQMVSSLGFTKGEWKLIGKLDSFNEKDWPIPNFKQYSDLLKCYYSIIYDQDLNEINRFKIDEMKAESLYPDGLAGYGFAEIVLSKYLKV